MINFACKQFDLKEIIKCSFGLTKSEYNLLKFLLEKNKEFTTEELSRQLSLDKSTIQRGVKSLHEKGLISRGQINQSVGGYVFLYRIKDRNFLIKKLLEIIDGWSEGVKKEIKNW